MQFDFVSHLILNLTNVDISPLAIFSLGSVGDKVLDVIGVENMTRAV
jgi:hypothetical protein